MIRAGSGADTVNAGDGDDLVVMVDTNPGAYTGVDLPVLDGQLPIKDSIDFQPIRDFVDDTAGLGFIIDGDILSGNTTDASAGDSIDGGNGRDSLFVFGRIDLSQVEISNVETLLADGDVTLDVSDLIGDGAFDTLELNALGNNGILRLTNTGGRTTGFKHFDRRFGVQQIELANTVTLEVAGEAELTSAAITSITGTGIIHVTDAAADGTNLQNFSVADGITVLATADGVVASDKLGATEPVFSGTDAIVG